MWMLWDKSWEQIESKIDTLNNYGQLNKSINYNYYNILNALTMLLMLSNSQLKSVFIMHPMTFLVMKKVAL